jgi:hypothetical protein
MLGMERFEGWRHHGCRESWCQLGVFGSVSNRARARYRSRYRSWTVAGPKQTGLKKVVARVCRDTVYFARTETGRERERVTGTIFFCW